MAPLLTVCSVISGKFSKLDRLHFLRGPDGRDFEDITETRPPLVTPCGLLIGDSKGEPPVTSYRWMVLWWEGHCGALLDRTRMLSEEAAGVEVGECSVEGDRP